MNIMQMRRGMGSTSFNLGLSAEAIAYIEQYSGLLNEVVSYIRVNPNSVDVVNEWPQVSHNLPGCNSGYKNRIITTGTQYIVTDIKLVAPAIVEFVALTSINNREQDVVGSWGNNGFLLGWSNANKVWVVTRNNSSNSIVSSNVGGMNVMMKIRADLTTSNTVLSSNDSIYAVTAAPLLNETTNYIGLFVNYGSTNPVHVTGVAEYIMIDISSQKHYFVPFNRNNENGLVDLYDNSFHGNNGTGTFSISLIAQ